MGSSLRRYFVSIKAKAHKQPYKEPAKMYVLASTVEYVLSGLCYGVGLTTKQIRRKLGLTTLSPSKRAALRLLQSEGAIMVYEGEGILTRYQLVARQPELVRLLHNFRERDKHRG